MKQKFLQIIAGVLLCGIFNAGFGQNDNRYNNPPSNNLYIPHKGDLELGVGVGLGSSVEYYTFSGDNTLYHDQFRTVFNASVSGDYYLSGRWSLKAKIIYDQKGWKDNSDGYYNFNLDYITVPVMANWHFGRMRNWYLNFGPYIGFLMNEKSPAYALGNGDTAAYPFHKLDAGLAFGIGVKIPIRNRLKFYIEFEEQSGIANILPSSENITANIERASFNIGINF